MTNLMLTSGLSWSGDFAIKAKDQTRLFWKTLSKQGDNSEKKIDAWNFCKEIHCYNGGGNLHFRWENLEKRNLSVAIFSRFSTFWGSNRSIFLTFTKVNIFFLIHNKCRDYFCIYIFINLILLFYNLENFSYVMQYSYRSLDFTNQNRIYL